MPATAKWVAATVLALFLLLVGAFVALTVLNLSPLLPHYHWGSPSYSGRDVSFLENAGGIPDSYMTVCDREGDGRVAKERAWDTQRGRYSYAYDRTGPNDGDCGHNNTRIVHESHETGEGDVGGWSGDVSFH